MLELDFLKRRDRTSDCYHQMRFLGSNATEIYELAAPDPAGGPYSALPDSLAGFEGAALPTYAYKSAGLL